MKIIPTLIFGAFLLINGFALGQPPGNESHCACNNCKCTKESHCGCVNGNGCACSKNCECSTLEPH